MGLNSLDNRIEVTVVLLTYNPDRDKLLATVESIIKQNAVSFELIVSDDGSADPKQDVLREYLEKKGFSNYTLLKNDTNVGTVRNYLNGILHAKGKYTYGISPGDLLYDENTLQDFFAFCEKNDADICFGDAVYYTNDGGFKLVDVFSNPKRPTLFYTSSVFRQKIAVFFGNYILGVTYFRKTDIALKYFQKIVPFVKYAEDTPSTLFALADGVRVFYNNRTIAWYEYGTGVSTKRESRWSQILNAEYKKTYEVLKEQYPDDTVIDAACLAKFAPNRRVGIVRRVVRHPYIALIALIQKLSPTRRTANDNNCKTINELYSLNDN